MNDDIFKGLDNETIAEIERLQQVTRDKDGGEEFAKAYRKLAKIYFDTGFYDKAIHANKEITILDHKDYYYKAQYNIGAALFEKYDYEKAINQWKSIQRENNLKVYMRAQFNIGTLLQKLNRFSEAKTAYLNVDINIDKSLYLKSRNNLANILIRNNETLEAISILRDLSSNSESILRDNARLMLGKLILIIVNIEKEGFEGYIDEAKSCFKSIKSSYPYESYCYMRICELLLDKDQYETGRVLESIFNQVNSILQKLVITFEDSLERKLAHYTTTDVANILLSTNDDVVGSLRLNTINNVNDPSEGHILDHYLNKYGSNVSYSRSFEEHFQAFVGCFTFNHNSLNQFRLYGKQDNLEASGVSLVFKSSFFNSESLSKGIAFLPSYLSISNQNQNTTSDIEDEVEVQPHEVNSDGKVSNLHIMRCVYIEPESRYVQLAQRNEITFYREFLDKKVAEDKWKGYKKFIYNTTKEVSEALEKLTSIYEELKRNHPKEFEENIELINKILLPLKYLIKHSAFQEEQECRMIYITSISSPEVIMDFGSALYIEYEPQVKSNLDKIYVAPAATHYQPYLAKLLSGTDVTIELSKLPYRHT